MRMIRFMMLLLASTSMAAAALAAQDAVETAERTINEYMLRGQFVDSCRPPQSEAERAAEDQSAAALGDAIFNQLWAHFDALDPTQHEANGEKADHTIGRLLANAGQRAEKVLQDKGCVGLEDELKALAR
jgi:hypothetical protein